MPEWIENARDDCEEIFINGMWLAVAYHYRSKKWIVAVAGRLLLDDYDTPEEAKAAAIAESEKQN